MDFETAKLIVAALALSLATGIFAFVPVLTVAISLHLMGVTVPGAEWLTQPLTIMALSLIALIEVAVDWVWGATHGVECANVVAKPAVAIAMANMVLPPDKATVITTLMVTAAASLTQLLKFKRKFTIGLLPGVNGLFATVGAVASVGIAVSAIELFHHTDRVRGPNSSATVAMRTETPDLRQGHRRGDHIAPLTRTTR